MLGVDWVTRRHVVLVIWSQWTGSVGSCVVRLPLAGRPRNTSAQDETRDARRQRDAAAKRAAERERRQASGGAS